MMSFCKNTLHAFLGISNRDILQSPPTTAPSTGLISITGDCRKPSNILESASLKPILKKDSDAGGSGGSLGEITSGGNGSSISGLSSCTESLGLESSEQMEETTIERYTSRSTSPLKRRLKKSRIREEVKKFPPMLSSMRRNQGDTSTSFLKPVRENGRLILTEVTINRPEVFRSSRENGRLRLQLLHQDSELVPRKEEELKMPVKNGGGGGVRGETSRWCHEQEHSHRHHLRQPLWNQQCVTSR